MSSNHRRRRDPWLRGNHDRSSAVIAVALTAVSAVVALGVAVTVLRDAPEPDRRPAATAASIAPGAATHLTPNATVASLAVLRDWDSARAKAWASGDVRALRRLYVSGSVAGRRDARMLRSWLGRGLTVHGMRMQISRIELRAHTATRMAFLITDRLAGAVAKRGRHRMALPRDAESTRLLRFVRRDGRWLLASAYDRPARPVATTDSTSGSANS